MHQEQILLPGKGCGRGGCGVSGKCKTGAGSWGGNDKNCRRGGKVGMKTRVKRVLNVMVTAVLVLGIHDGS